MNKKVYRIFTPVNIKGTDTKWSIVVTIPLDEMYIKIKNDALEKLNGALNLLKK